ncbi:MAG: ComF family protein [Sphingomicrobium sp.]
MMAVLLNLKALGGKVLDFALPPRCASCGAIVDQLHSFCADCWKHVAFLGDAGCTTCGLPLEATDAEQCAVCLARPPRIERTRAAVEYDDVTRGLAIRLKYGRKIALARTMARYMAPLLPDCAPNQLLVPVPLHRTRLWWRGFNQAAMIARELSRSTGMAASPFALRRSKRTPSLRGLSATQRRRAVAGAFFADRDSVAGKTIILIDDVLTTGSTANGCARALKRAGAARVELITWARVVRPTQFMR